MLASILKTAGKVLLGAGVIAGVVNAVKSAYKIGTYFGAAQTVENLKLLEDHKPGLSSAYIKVIDTYKNNTTTDVMPSMEYDYLEGINNAKSHSINQTIWRKFETKIMLDIVYDERYKVHNDIKEKALIQRALNEYIHAYHENLDLYQLDFKHPDELSVDIVFELACDSNLVCGSTDGDGVWVMGEKYDMDHFVKDFWGAYNLLALEKGKNCLPVGTYTFDEWRNGIISDDD